MATWRLNAHNVAKANEALRKVTIWSSTDRSASPTNYYTVTVGIGTSDGKVDVVGTYDGSADVLTGNEVRDLTGSTTIDRLLREGDSLIIDVESVGSPALTASGLTVEWHLELVGGNSQGFKPAFQSAGYVPDQRVRAAIGGLEQQLNTSGVASWTVAVPLMDPVEASSLSDALDAVFQGRIQRDSATQISLQRYSGDTCIVAGEVVSIGSTGLTLTTSAPLINSSGTAASAPGATATLYYVYLIGPQGSYAPNTLKMSATGPTLGENGYYLGTSGNAANCRFVGWVKTNATPNFVDTITDRLVINYYNRRPLTVLLTPGYADGNTLTTYTTTSTTFTAANGGTGATGSYIANGEDAVDISAHSMCVAGSNTTSAMIGIGDNSSTAAVVEAFANQNVIVCSVGCRYSSTPTAGWREAHLLVRVTGSTGTYYADDVRGGSAADPYATYMIVRVMG